MPSQFKIIKRRIKKALGLQSERPPFTGRYYEKGRQLLLDTIDIFNEADLPYLIDAGALLGLARDGDLIPWDNDIDCLLPVTEVPRLKKLYWLFRRRGWQISRMYQMPFPTDAWAVGDPRVIKIRSRGKFLVNPGKTMLEVNFIYPRGEHFYWESYGKVLRVPRNYFDTADCLEYAGRRVRVPSNYEAYLEIVYGDWRTPRQEFDSNDLGIIFAEGEDSRAGPVRLA